MRYFKFNYYICNAYSLMKNIYKIQSFTLPIVLPVQVGKPLCSVGII